MLCILLFLALSEMQNLKDTRTLKMYQNSFTLVSLIIAQMSIRSRIIIQFHKFLDI